MTQALHIEVINLERAVERRAQMQSAFSQVGIPAQFHPAFDAKQSPHDIMLEHCTETGPWGRFDPPNMAVTISHAQVWERFLASSATYCVVFEDDVFLSPDLLDWLSDMSWWPNDADLVKIESWRGKSTKVLMAKTSETHLGRHLRQMHSRHVGAAGYILTRPAAKLLLADRPFRQPIDNHLFNANASPTARRLNIYQVTPAMVIQGNEPYGAEHSITGRAKPKGWALLSQKLRRGYYEIAYPLPTFFKFLMGKLTLEPVKYEARASGAFQKS